MSHEKPHASGMSAAGRAAAERARARRAAAQRQQRPEELRAATEDDDGYDPYSDYMDALARRPEERSGEDPWL